MGSGEMPQWSPEGNAEWKVDDDLEACFAVLRGRNGNRTENQKLASMPVSRLSWTHTVHSRGSSQTRYEIISTHGESMPGELVRFSHRFLHVEIGSLPHSMSKMWSESAARALSAVLGMKKQP
jgi:hypothetical protein